MIDIFKCAGGYTERLGAFNIATGVGLVLVVLPGAALFLGMDRIGATPAVGLPLVAIFGIILLFGAMALTAMLFIRLRAGNRSEALALPTGSVRAVMGLSLIVLFAVIVMMLFQALANRQTVRIHALSEQDTRALRAEARNRVFAVLEEPCPAEQSAAAVPVASAAQRAASAATAAGAAAGTAGAAGTSRPGCYQVLLLEPVPQDAVDLAKQLLTLIGTLVTTVIGFYFGARTAEPPKPSRDPGDGPQHAANALPPTPAPADHPDASVPAPQGP